MGCLIMGRGGVSPPRAKCINILHWAGKPRPYDDGIRLCVDVDVGDDKHPALGGETPPLRL
jgi:hypothetical protein